MNMSGNVRYTRKIVSDKTLEEMKELSVVFEEKRYKDLEVNKFGIYLDDDDRAVYGVYIGSFLLRGVNKDELLREIEIYERFKGV